MEIGFEDRVGETSFPSRGRRTCDHDRSRPSLIQGDVTRVEFLRSEKKNQPKLAGFKRESGFEPATFSPFCFATGICDLASERLGLALELVVVSNYDRLTTRSPK